MLCKRHFYTSILCFYIIISISSLNISSYAYTGVDSWFSEEIAGADELGVIPEVLSGCDMSSDVTRAEFCETALAAYNLFNEKRSPSSFNYFSDTFDSDILLAYEAGLVSGYEDGTFKPNKKISRQEMFKMIFNLMLALGEGDYLTEAEASRMLSGYKDLGDLQDWATVAAGSLIDWGITKGTSDATIEPLAYSSRSQAVVLTYRSASKLMNEGKLALYSGSKNEVLEEDPFIVVGSDDYGQHNVVIFVPDENDEIPVLTDPTADNSGNDDLHHDNSSIADIGNPGMIGSTDSSGTSGSSNTAGSGSASNPGGITSPPDVSGDTEPSYSGTIDYDSDFDSDFRTNENLTSISYNEDKYALIFGSANANKYMSAEEAESHMVSVKVPVWRLNSDGSKTGSYKYIDVNRAIADITLKIFTEIYQSDEQFPINSLGCYSWRGDSSNSSHKWGIAFDINPTQNYYISANGTVYSGSYWRPGEDELSISEDSDVIKIFAKYGFAWGGNAWTSSRDYMHFSYFGN